MAHRCRECPDKRMFSIGTGTVMESSRLGFRTWAIAVYLVTTNIKGVSGMKLHRDLGVTQKTAWHLAHRIRKSLEMSAVPVAGVKDRSTGNVSADVVDSVGAKALQGFVTDRTAPTATDYKGMSFKHETVTHGVGEYVRDRAHTNGIESFRALLKRGYHGTFHHMGEKHLNRHVTEFYGHYDDRNAGTLDQMAHIAQNVVGKRMPYSRPGLRAVPFSGQPGKAGNPDVCRIGREPSNGVAQREGN